MRKGHCNCGAIGFDIAADDGLIHVCHCSICRRATGIGSIPTMLARKGDFVWTGGEDLISIWHKPGADWLNAFCGRCGSPLPRANDDLTMAIPAGLLVDSDDLKIGHPIRTGARQMGSTGGQIQDSACGVTAKGGDNGL